MKRRIVLLLAGVLMTIGAAGVWALLHQESEIPQAPRPPKIRSSAGSIDDPYGRARHEWLRLHDPATGRIPSGIRERELAFAATLPTRENAQGMSNAAITWNRRGPYNVGGRTRAMAYDVSNTSVILAGGVSGGMWRSTNSGGVWTKTTDAAALHSVTCLAQDTRTGHTQKWYYGTGEYTGNSASAQGSALFQGNGIFKSTNGGVTWTLLSSTASGTPQTFDNLFDFVWNVATDPSNTTQEEVYAATYGSIQRSTNGGTSWTPVLGGASPYSASTDVAVTTTGIVYAAGSSGSNMSGMRRSTNGTTWTNITPTTGFPTVYGRITIAIAPSNENIVYFLLQGANSGTGVGGHQLWRYDASTGNWINRGGNLPNETGLANNGVFSTQGGYDQMICVRPNDPNFVIVGGVNLYRSTDGFATSTNTARIGGYLTASTYADYTNHHADQHAGMFLPGSNTTFLSAHDGGLSRTTDIAAATVSWTRLNNGYFTTQFYAVGLDRRDPGNNIVLGGTQDNGTWFVNSTSQAANWVKVHSGDGGFLELSWPRGSYYLSSQYGTTYRYLLNDNGGGTTTFYWTRVDPVNDTGYLFITPFVLDRNFTNRMYLAGKDRIKRNTNVTEIPMGSSTPATLNWSDLTNTILTGRKISALEHTLNAPTNRLYYGTTNGEIYKIDAPSTGNPTPVNIWTGKGLPANAYVSCIAVDPFDGEHAIAVFSNYSVVSLYRTTNGGTNWAAIAGNLEQFASGAGNGPSVRWAEIVRGRFNNYYLVGTSTGLYSTESIDGMATVWVQEGSTTIGNVVVDHIDSRQPDGVVIVGTHGAGVFSGQHPLPLDVEVGEGVPQNFALHQNYPNPFNPATTIRFSVPHRSPVSLTVHDIQGRVVKVLSDQQQYAPGDYRMEWDGTNAVGRPVASGVYFARMQAEGYISSVKMALVK